MNREFEGGFDNRGTDRLDDDLSLGDDLSFYDSPFGEAIFDDLVADVDGYPSAGEYSSFHDVDTSAEVDAAFRSQRRIAVGHFTVFVIGIVGLGLSILFSEWAISDRVLGGFSPSFLLAAIGLYGLFVIIAVAGASLANGVDNKMLGASSLPQARSRSGRSLPWRLLPRRR